MPLRDDFTDADAQASVHSQHHNDLAVRVNELTGMTFLGEILLAVDTAPPFTFDNIPQTFRHLKLISAARSNYALGGTDNIRIQFNGDTIAHYDAFIEGAYDNATSGGTDPRFAGGTATWSAFANAGPPNNIRIANVPTVSGVAPAGSCAYVETVIPFYTNPNFHKGAVSNSISFRGPQMGAAAAADTGPALSRHYGRWLSVDPISRIDIILSLGTQLLLGSQFTLYGF